MQAGKLRRKIIIQENQYPLDELGKPQRDEYGAPINNWVDVLTCRASMEPLSGREYFAAAQVQAEQMTRFRIRYPRFQIWPGMRVKYRDVILNADRYFDINAVIDQNEMHVEVFIMATEQIKPLAPAGGGSSSGSSSGTGSGDSSGDDPIEPTSPYYPAGADCLLYHAYWDGTALDHSQYGNDGTPYGGYTFIPEGILLDGLDVSRIEAPAISLGVSLSIEGWISIASFANSPIFVAQGPPPDFNWLLGGDSSGKFSALTQWDNNSAQCLTSTIQSPNQFYHIAYTSDVAESPDFKLYVNGVERTESSVVSPTSDLIPGGRPIEIGALALGGDSFVPTSCTIGEVRLWKKVLSQSDITSIFNATKARYGV